MVETDLNQTLSCIQNFRLSALDLISLFNYAKSNSIKNSEGNNSRRTQNDVFNAELSGWLKLKLIENDNNVEDLLLEILERANKCLKELKRQVNDEYDDMKDFISELKKEESTEKFDQMKFVQLAAALQWKSHMADNLQ